MGEDRWHLGALRPEDLLALDFEFVNLRPAASGSLERITPEEPALVVVHVGPQHLAEQVFAADSGSVEQPPIRTVMAGGSRLVFRLPDSVASLPLTLAALLDWGAWEPVVASGPPGPLQTAIEFPWRLLLSPDAALAWQHPDEPITLDGHTQVWRTHLTPGDVRAVADVPGQNPFPISLAPQDRRNIVQLTSPAEGQPGAKPLTARRFSLSTLGASAHLSGDWPDGPPTISLRKYEHIAAQGRDHLVRTVRAGFLCGTGHRAVIVATAERAPVTHGQVGTAGGGGALFGTAAYMMQRWEVIVEQPVMDYAPMSAAYAFEGREMPLRAIRLLTRSAQVQGTPGVAVTTPVWLLTPEGKPLFFKASALDVTANQIDFELPLMFVPLEAIDNVALIRSVFQSPPFTASLATRVSVGGQAVAMAPPGEKPGSTNVKAQLLRFGLATVGAPASEFGLKAAGRPPSYPPSYLPFIAGAEASLPAVDELLGGATTRPVELDPTYLAGDFGPGNPAQTFVRLKNPLQMAFDSQQGGGLVRPNSAAEALSRTLGAVASPDALKAGKIDLSAFSEARFLGTIRLLDLIPGNLPLDAASAAPDPPTQAQLDDPGFRLAQPRLITRRLPDGGQPRVETRFLWKPPLETKSFGPLTVELGGADLLLDARTVRSLSGQGTSLVIGRLRQAALTFAEAISVKFGELLFRAEEGRKLEVGAKNVTLTFAGPLEFVNSLRSILPENGFDDPPFLTVDGQGVVAGYTLGVPTIGVGVFSLQNIALSSTISIPFTDRPAGVRFAISERHKPFLVTVSLFGGGGFFALAVSANGLEQIEASIEFGGNIALNLVVASGGVHVMAGIYFALTAGSVTLTGYLRCGGYLEVLGLISVSVEFYLAFTYRKKDAGGSEVWGQATLTVCVKVAFFSKSVSLSVERRFAGSDGDPSFAETVSPEEWAAYLLAFA